MSGDQPSLRRLLGRTAAWSTLDVIVGRLGQFAQGVVVARLVEPKYFGVFAIALVVHTVVVNVSELGVSAALIRDDPEHAPRSAPTVVTISLVSAALLATLIVAGSHEFARALGSANAAAPIMVMALNLPLAGLTAVPTALLKRDFKMKRIFVADVANMLTSGVVVVVLAVAGWGALALAWSWVAGQVVTTVLLLTYRPGRFWPGWRRAEARRLLAFGLPLAGSNLLGFLVLNVDYIVVGRTLGPEALGVYVLAFNMAGWPINLFGFVLDSVALPGFSRLSLRGSVMSAEFIRAVRLVAGVTLPVCLIMGALARPAVVAIYGPRWSSAASALVGLSLLAAGRLLVTVAGAFLVSLGRTRAVLVAQVPWLVSLTVALIVVAPRFGIRGVGFAQAGVVVLVIGPVYAVLLSRAGVSVRALIRALTPPAAWAVLAAAGAHAVAVVVGNPFLGCVSGGLVGVTIAAIPFAKVIVRHASAILRRGVIAGSAHDPAETVVQT